MGVCLLETHKDKPLKPTSQLLNLKHNNNNNNNNNYKTSIVPISSKRIALNGAPCTGVGQTHSPSMVQISSTNDQMEWKLRKDKHIFIL